MNAPAERRPTGAAVTAALTPFMGGPVAFAIFAFALADRHEEGGLFEGLARAWQEGGWPMYLVVLVGGLVAAGCAACMFFGVQRGSLAILASAPLSALITAVGAFGFWNGMRNAIEAVAHVNPADKATIMAAATSEALTSSAFGISGTAGLLASLSLGCLFGVVAQTGVARKVLVFSGAAFFTLALISLSAVLRLGAVMGLFRALAYVAPVDRLTILIAGSEELQVYRLPFLGLLGLFAVVLAVGAVTLKESPRGAVLLPLLGLGGLVGLGLHAGAQTGIERSTAALVTRPAGAGLVDLPGYFDFEGATRCLGADRIGDCTEGDALTDEALADELGAWVRRAKDEAEYSFHGGGPLLLPIGVKADSSAQSLWRFIDASIGAGAFGISLVGEQEGAQPKVASELAVFVTLFRSKYRSVPVGLFLAGQEQCGHGQKACDPATAKGEELVVGGATWKAGPLKGEASARPDFVLVQADRTMTPQVLVKLALAASSQGRRLVLVLPRD